MRNKLEEWRDVADTALARRDVAKALLKETRAKVVDEEDRLEYATTAQQIAQAVAETVQQEAHGRISAVVKKALAIVFEEAYDFRIRFEQARGRTEAHLVFVRNGEEVKPMDAAGGGAVDVAAFALRLASLMLARPQRRRVMVLDEPFKFVSADRRSAVRAMLEQLSDELGVQFIMVTHIEELQCGTVIDLNQ